jgi:hypothetical protein
MERYNGYNLRGKRYQEALVRPKRDPFQTLPDDLFSIFLLTSSLLALESPLFLSPHSSTGFLHDAQSQHLSIFPSRRYLNDSLQVTKRYVVRVCHRWNESATPFLYEHTQIHRVRDIERMFKTLALPFTGRARSDTISIFGHLARRLDISLPSGWDRPRWGGEDFLKLFRLTPNLTTVRTDYQVFKWIMADSLWKDTTLPNLGRVDLAESFKTPSPPGTSHCWIPTRTSGST